VIGKLSVLFVLLSAITWVPDLILFGLHGGLSGGGWITSHLNLAWAIFAGSLLWIGVQSLLALAVSAWLKWRIAASGLMVGIFFVAAGFGEAVNGILRTYWGHLFNLGYLLMIIWYDLFDIPVVRRMPRAMAEDFGWNRDIPVGIAWIAMVSLCFCCVLLLNRRLRAKEVVRG
jgi:ABC-2 type transport system permease protein